MLIGNSTRLGGINGQIQFFILLVIITHLVISGKAGILHEFDKRISGFIFESIDSLHGVPVCKSKSRNKTSLVLNFSRQSINLISKSLSHLVSPFRFVNLRLGFLELV